jgi:hypothetical protein
MALASFRKLDDLLGDHFVAEVAWVFNGRASHFEWRLDVSETARQPFQLPPSKRETAGTRRGGRAFYCRPPHAKGTVFGRKSVLDAGQGRKIAERYAAGETMRELAID